MAKALVHIRNKTIRVVADATAPAAGEINIGTVDHAGAPTHDSQGFKPSHVLYTHIEELMNKAKLYDKHLYRISVVA